uniref:H3 histone n=1 Tax=Spironucleus vortens TaxID=58336 RepID=A7Y0D9_SPIVO|nr:H3 histone [Spironucleus vortens]
MARTKHTSSTEARGARKGLKAPRKTVIAKKIIARKSVSDARKATSHRRAKQGAVAQREIKAQQKMVSTALPRLPFSKLVRSISLEHGADYRFQSSALLALQEACEQVLVTMMADAQLLAQHGHRVTIMDKDVKIWLQITRPVWVHAMNPAQ